MRIYEIVHVSNEHMECIHSQGREDFIDFRSGTQIQYEGLERRFSEHICLNGVKLTTQDD